MYDEENFLDDIKTTLENNLNAKISSIVAEKADGITPKAITKFYFQNIPQESNTDAWVVYGISDITQGESNGPGFAQTVKVKVVVHNESVMNSSWDIIYRTYNRYTRAIREVIQAKFSKIGGHGRLKIESWSLPRVNPQTGEVLELPGVEVTATFG